MLSGIFGKKSDHPLADIKSTQALLDGLSKSDAYKSLTEIAEWMELLADNADFKPDHHFDVARLLDEAARPHARRLARDYFITQELNRFQENRLWLVLDNLCRHTARAYYAVFIRHCNGDKGSGAVKAQLPLLTARTVHAMTMQLKYACARYGPIDNSIWNNLAQLYRHAEQQQYLETPLALYQGMDGDASVKGEIGRLLGWYGCGVNTLSPLFMHLTERIAGQYCSSIDIGAQRDSSSLFVFDMDNPSAPVQVKVRAAERPSARFVSMARMQPRLEALIATLERGMVPESLNMGCSYDTEPVREAAQYLLDYLAAPPARRNARRAIKVGLKVVNGLDKAIGRLNTAPDSSGEQPSRWDAEDISASGFRAVLPAQELDGIRIGSLLGVQPEGVAHWGAAVVRRLLRDDENRLHLGVEMLSNQVAGVILRQTGRGGGFEDGQSALWLQAKSGETSGGAQLLMKAGAFSAHRSLLAELGGRKYLLIPSKLLEKGHDYDLANFRAIEQETGS